MSLTQLVLTTRVLPSQKPLSALSDSINSCIHKCYPWKVTQSETQEYSSKYISCNDYYDNNNFKQDKFISESSVFKNVNKVAAA